MIPTSFEERGAAPNCEDTGKMLGVQGGGKEILGALVRIGLFGDPE